MIPTGIPRLQAVGGSKRLRYGVIPFLIKVMGKQSTKSYMLTETKTISFQSSPFGALIGLTLLPYSAKKKLRNAVPNVHLSVLMR